jgi:hypothetical protein
MKIFRSLFIAALAMTPTVLVLIAGSTGMLSAGCASSYDPTQTTKVITPDYDIYATYLDGFVNRRCGTLDCHGSTGRAFRHYGNLGLRRLEGRADELGSDAGFKDAGPKRTGKGATTADEVRANFAGIVALEPEVISRIVALNNTGDVDAQIRKWMFLRKALGRPDVGRAETEGERHKGGNSLEEADPGYVCISKWLKAPRKPSTWKAAGASTGDSGPASLGSRVNPSTPEEKEYAAYLKYFDDECTKSLDAFR